MRIEPNWNANEASRPLKAERPKGRTKPFLWWLLFLAMLGTNIYVARNYSHQLRSLTHSTERLSAELKAATLQTEEQKTHFESIKSELARTAISYIDEFLVLDPESQREKLVALEASRDFPEPVKPAINSILSQLEEVELVPTNVSIQILSCIREKAFTTIDVSPNTPLTHLSRSQFRIMNDGKMLHQATLFALEAKTKASRNIALLIDRSSSIQPSIEECKAEAARACKKLVDFAAVKVFAFNEKLDPLTTWTTSEVELARAISSIQADGATALKTALSTVMQELQSMEGDNSIVLISDGRDSDAGAMFDQIIEQAQIQGITLHTVGLNTTADHTRLLEQLASETKGCSMRVSRMDELSAFFEAIDKTLQTTTYRFLILDPINPEKPIILKANNGQEIQVPIAN